MSAKFFAPTVLLIVAVTIGILAYKAPKSEKASVFIGLTTKKLMNPENNLPPLWLFYNDGDVNSRNWADFMGRSSRALNRPYLNLCYETIVNASKGKYRIEVIQGLGDAISRLGGPEFVPSPLRNTKAFLQEEEIQFLSMAFLTKFGGLWMNPSTICIRSLPELPKDSIIGFGTSNSETYSGVGGTVVPNISYLWVPVANHPVPTKWASILFERQNGFTGGQRVRRDAQWDWTFVTTGHKDIKVLPQSTVQRKANGRRIELDDLLSSDGTIPFPIPDDAFMVPVPFFELDRRSSYQWFLRMSEDQIMESDLAITYLFDASKESLSQTE
jgi:hypothetical protein